MEPEGELGHDPEVPAATPKCPEEVRVLGLARGQRPTVGGDDLCREKVVAGQAVPAGQVPDPAAEGEPADPGRGDDPARGRQPVRTSGLVEFTPGRTPADAGGPG